MIRKKSYPRVRTGLIAYVCCSSSPLSSSSLACPFSFCFQQKRPFSSSSSPSSSSFFVHSCLHFGHCHSCSCFLHEPSFVCFLFVQPSASPPHGSSCMSVPVSLSSHQCPSCSFFHPQHSCSYFLACQLC